jgi:hypothetical protein
VVSFFLMQPILNNKNNNNNNNNNIKNGIKISY